MARDSLQIECWKLIEYHHLHIIGHVIGSTGEHMAIGLARFHFPNLGTGLPRIGTAPTLVIGLLSASLFGLFYMAALNNPSIVRPPRPVAAAAPAPKPAATPAPAPVAAVAFHVAPQSPAVTAQPPAAPDLTR